MSFDDVLLRVTASPAGTVNAQQVRVEQLGSLEVGAPADIALSAIEVGQFTLVDSQKNAVTANKRIVRCLSICRGHRMQAIG